MNAKVVITRLYEGSKSTVGILEIIENNRVIFMCKTLENLFEGYERNKDLRIPPDEYKLYWRNSPSKGRKVHVYNEMCPKDRCIMFHVGNKEEDTLGCILLGINERSDNDWVFNSTIATKDFERIMERYGDLSEVPLIIQNKIYRYGVRI